MWESELFSAVMASPRSLGIQSELQDLGSTCAVVVDSDSQSAIDHSRRRCRSVASKHVGLRGLWLQEAIVDTKLALVKVHTAVILASSGSGRICFPRESLREAGWRCSSHGHQDERASA